MSGMPSFTPSGPGRHQMPSTVAGQADLFGSHRFLADLINFMLLWWYIPAFSRVCCVTDACFGEPSGERAYVASVIELHASLAEHIDDPT